MRTIIFFAIAALAMACSSPSAKKNDAGTAAADKPIREVSVNDARRETEKAYSQLVDVRTVEEYDSGHAERARNIPLDTLPSKLDILEKNEPVYLICESGNRSKKAAEILKQAGFADVINVAGGTKAWKAAGLPIETKPPHTVPAK
jgi:rhodanese-related sulfurtransferase